MQASDLAVLVLAAGRGQRLGGVAKALLLMGDGRTYLEHIWDRAREAGVPRGVVVVGQPHAAAVTACAARLRLAVVTNPQPERGMASSIELGIGWAEQAGAAAVLLWPCDHPRVAGATIAALIAQLGAHDAAVPVVPGGPDARERGGHPALIGRALFARLARCQREPQGARSVLRAADVVRVPVDDPGCALDVDDAAAAAALAVAR